ncbi:hypothetical protein BC332_32771 [Capsicum chinense]|nr:hypothetical protein BC332_32771 [Capsicum chinense]
MADQDEEVDHPPEDANGNAANQNNVQPNEEPLFDFEELPQDVLQNPLDFQQLLQDTDEHPLDHHEIPQGLDQQPLEYQHHQPAHVIHDQPENENVNVDHHLDDLAVHQDPPPLEPQHQAIDNHNNVQQNPEPPPLQRDHRCGACKGGRNETCPPNCRFRPYFPPNSAEDYLAIIRTFSRKNIERWANGMPIGERAEFYRRRTWEAEHFNHRAGGFYQIVHDREAEIAELKQESENQKQQIARLEGENDTLKQFLRWQPPPEAANNPFLESTSRQDLSAEPANRQQNNRTNQTQQHQVPTTTIFNRLANLQPSQAPAAAVQRPDANFQPLLAQPPAHQPDPIPPGTSQRQAGASTRYIGPAVQHSHANFQPLQAQPPAHQPDPIPPGTSQAQADASTSYIGHKRCR